MHLLQSLKYYLSVNPNAAADVNASKHLLELYEGYYLPTVSTVDFLEQKFHFHYRRQCNLGSTPLVLG